LWLLFDQLPLARSLKRLGSPDVGIEDVTLIIGYHNSTPPTLGRGFNHLGKKPAVFGMLVAPLLSNGKSRHLLNCPLEI
jgi:hypothetical protein